MKKQNQQNVLMHFNSPLKTNKRSDNSAEELVDGVLMFYLEEASYISNDISEDVVIFLTVEPAQFGDPGVQLDQSLGDKCC